MFKLPLSFPIVFRFLFSLPSTSMSAMEPASFIFPPEFTLGTRVKLLLFLKAMSWLASPPVVTHSVCLLHTSVASVGGTSYTTTLNYLCCWSRDLASPRLSWLEQHNIKTYLKKKNRQNLAVDMMLLLFILLSVSHSTPAPGL